MTLSARPGNFHAIHSSFWFPRISKDTVAVYMQMFPQGVFVTESEGVVRSASMSIRVSEEDLHRQNPWHVATGENDHLRHQPAGDSLFVARTLHTHGWGSRTTYSELGPLLKATQALAVELGLKCVGFPAWFPGKSERWRETANQRALIYGSRPHPNQHISMALHLGFEHGIALPDYFEGHTHFALMVWRNGTR